MKRHPLTLTCLLIVILLIPAAARTDWPAWRGPFRDDVSQASGLLKKWPEGGPKKLWTTTEAGIGYSSFAVVGDRLYTMGASDSEESLIAFDTTTGNRLWERSVGERWTNNWGDGPRSTPAVQDDSVVSIGGRGRVVCASASDGSERWSAELTDLGGSIPNWGYSESTLIDGNLVLCTPGGSDGAIVALDLATGNKVWQSTEMTQPAHYSSIIIGEINNQKQYIQLGPEALYAVNPDDGALLWQQDWPGKVAVIPTPIVYNNSVYVASGYGVGSMLVDIKPGNEVRVRYQNKVMKNHHGGVIRVGDQVYGYSDGPGWVCQELESGEMTWNEKRGLGKGAIACADGMFYCLDENSGTCALIEVSPEGWNEHGRFDLSPQSAQRSPNGRIWTHPVIANGRLYLRDQEIICCYAISDSRTTSTNR